MAPWCMAVSARCAGLSISEPDDLPLRFLCTTVCRVYTEKHLRINPMLNNRVKVLQLIKTTSQQGGPRLDPQIDQGCHSVTFQCLLRACMGFLLGLHFLFKEMQIRSSNYSKLPCECV